MGLDVFGRIKDIVSANIDELLSKAEDPEKMADQMVRKYEDAIKDLLGSTASVMASAREAKAKVDACDAEIKKYGTYAERALRDGNEEKARQAITLKQEQEDLRPTLMQSYVTVKVQADKAEEDYRKLTAGLDKTKARAEAMKNTVRTARVKNQAGEVQMKSVSLSLIHIFARPFIKYTPTWPRSFMPQNQGERNLIAKMKLIPVDALIRGKSMLLRCV